MEGKGTGVFIEPAFRLKRKTDLMYYHANFVTTLSCTTAMYGSTLALVELCPAKSVGWL